MSDLSVQLTSNKHIKNVAEALEKASKNKLSQKEIAEIIRKESHTGNREFIDNVHSCRIKTPYDIIDEDNS